MFSLLNVDENIITIAMAEIDTAQTEETSALSCCLALLEKVRKECEDQAAGWTVDFDFLRDMRIIMGKDLEERINYRGIWRFMEEANGWSGEKLTLLKNSARNPAEAKAFLANWHLILTAENSKQQK